MQMFDSHPFLIGALTFGFASFVYIFYGPSQSSKRKDKNDKNSAVSGLLNYGNQCFINSVLQSLAACNSMIIWLNYVITLRVKSHCDDGYDDENMTQKYHSNLLAYHVLKTLKVLNNADSGMGEASPIDVLHALRAHRWSISNEEQDACELFNILTSTLECELYSSLPVYSLKDVLLIEELLKNTMSPERSRSSISTRSSSNVHTLMVDNRIPKSLPTKGMLASQLKCRTCGYKYPVHLDTFDSISLVIPNNIFGIPILLQDCLNKFVSNEIIHEVTCEGCTQLGNCNKSAFIKNLTFAKLPQLLCFHMQRLVWYNNGQPLKRFEHVAFPEYLNMDPYVYKSQKGNDISGNYNTVGLIGGASTPVKKTSLKSDDAPHTAPHTASHTLSAQLSSCNVLPDGDHAAMAKYKYKLCSVIVHLGDASSGHFICYRRGADLCNQWNWYYCSDNSVVKITLSEVLRSTAYMLFYERVQNTH